MAANHATPGERGEPAAAPAVRRIPLPMPRAGSTVNAYLLAGRPLTLLDAGYATAESVAALEAALAAAGATPADVEQLVVTHAHPDHYGGVQAVVRAAAAAGRRVRVLAHPRTAAILADPATWWERVRAHSQGLLRRTGAPPSVLSAGARDGSQQRPRPPPDYTMPLPVDVPLADGTLLEAAGQPWQVLYTPGHASTQLCLYGPTTQHAFTSDHLLPDTTANIVLEPPWPGEPVAYPLLDYLASLRRLKRLPIACVWPGHGPAFTDAAATIVARIERCEQRLEQAAALVSSAPRTAWQVAEAMYAGTTAAGSTRALFQVVAYLEALVKLGRVTIADEDGITRYYPAH